MANERFLNRWSRLKRDRGPAPETAKADAPRGAPAQPVPPGPEHGEAIGAPLEAPAGSSQATAAGDGVAARGPARPPSVQPPHAGEAPPPLPALDSLGFESDYSPFMRSEVDPGLRMSALKKLFADPHFNRMDGLDVYIDDYGKPDPMPRAMLARLSQSRLLGLFEEEKTADGAPPTGAAGQPIVAQPVAIDTEAGGRSEADAHADQDMRSRADLQAEADAPAELPRAGCEAAASEVDDGRASDGKLPDGELPSQDSPSQDSSPASPPDHRPMT